MERNRFFNAVQVIIQARIAANEKRGGDSLESNIPGEFGLEMILDNDGNMILTDGLVLQEEKYWTEFLGKEILPENNSCELYFEEADIEGFIEKLESYYPEVKYVNRLMTYSWGQKVIRFYDPDGNLIEVGTPA